MATASTNSHRKGKSRSVAARDAAGPGKSVAVAASLDTPPEIDRRTWLLACTAVLVVAAFLRLYDLDLVPLHHDEGVNGNFLVPLVRKGAQAYHYDPTNYHGPTLYFFSAVIPRLARLVSDRFGDAYGLTTFNIRFVTSLFGVGTVWLVLMLRRRLGTIGALAGAALLAISPGAVYLSRYFIHETLFVFFALGIVVTLLQYYDTGRWPYLYLAAISAALMTATKETWIINLPVILIAFIVTQVYFWLRNMQSGKAKRKSGSPRLTFGQRLSAAFELYGGPVFFATVVVIALALFIDVNALFYSSFFKNYPKGVHDALLTLSLWSGRTTEHAKPWAQYLEWLRESEAPLLLLGGVGAAISLWRADNRFALFVAQWAFGSLAAYSLVGYKTPWIALNFVVPLAITGGYALDVLYRRSREPVIPLALAMGAIALLGYEINLRQNWYLLAPLVLALVYMGVVFYLWTNAPGNKAQLHFFLAAAVIVAFSGYQMFQLNFVHYDDDRYTYVYAHTRREFLAMLDEVDRVVARSGSGPDTGVTVVSTDYWPLPWYFRNLNRVGYFGRMNASNEPIVIGSLAQESELRTTFGSRYDQIRNPRSENGSYALRPGVDLLLFVRRDLAH